jgi:hypothetical protein
VNVFDLRDDNASKPGGVPCCAAIISEQCCAGIGDASGPHREPLAGAGLTS